MLYAEIEYQVWDCRGKAGSFLLLAEDGGLGSRRVEAKRRGPAVAARLSGRAEIYKERLDRERLRDPETGVEYLLATLRPFFVKDLQSVFLYRFFQLLRCNRGQTDHQRWMIKYEIARQKAVDAWLEASRRSC